MGREKRSLQIGIRLTDTGRYLMEQLQEHFGLSQASVFEMLLRDEARRQGLRIPGSGADLEQRKEAERLANLEKAKAGKKTSSK
jgi:hypothetical protein